MSLIGAIEHFDRTLGDFDTYMERMEQFMIINKITEDMKVPLFITLIGQETFSTLKNLLVPDNPCGKPYKMLVDTLKLYFSPKRVIIAERFKFNNCNRKDSESVNDYIIELKRMSKTCEFGSFLNDALRDRLVCGIKSTSIQRKLLAECSLSFEEACEIALSMELADEQSKYFQPLPICSLKNKVKENQGSTNPMKYSPKYKYKFNHDDHRRGQCFRCGRHHNSTSCSAKEWECYTCHKKGHISRMCSSRKKSVHAIGEEEENDEFSVHDELGHIGLLDNKTYPLILNVKLDSKVVNMEVDTGACATVMSESFYKKHFANNSLKSLKSTLRTVTGCSVETIGKMNVKIEFNSKIHYLDVIVIKSESDFKPLLGRTWLDVIFPNWKQNMMSTVETKCLKQSSKSISSIVKNDIIVSDSLRDHLVKELKSEFPSVFKNDGKSSIRNNIVEIRVKDNCTPIFHKAYRIPYALLEPVEKELTKLKNEGIIVPVENSDWCSPIVIVPKKNGNIRICVDFKVTVNKVIENVHYPLPCLEDIFATLSGKKVFCVLDLSGAYQQLEIGNSSRKYFTINTHLGLYQYTRLTYGISTAPMIFQSVMDKMLNGIAGVCCYLDDILISGINIQECVEKSKVVFRRLSEHNVKINDTKCKFFANSVEYLGHIVDMEGTKPTKNKVKAILDAPIPENLTQLRSYLGMLNFYNKFLPMLSTELRSLYELQEKGKEFNWSEKCSKAFNRSKQLIIENNLLVHYDPNQPIVVSCDASPYGVGAVLSHVIDGVEKPVLFASSTLSKAEKNYAQVEREALALIFAVKKFHKYIYGRKFQLVTDHQPLKTIFNPGRGIPTLAAARLQRWALILQAYDYTVVYRKGSENVIADALSRLPITESTNDDPERLFVNSFNMEDIFPLTYKEVAKYTSSDMVLVKVYDMIIRGWPNYIQDVNLRPYYQKRFELSVEQGCIIWGLRVVIPRNLREKVLIILHEQHVGIVRMKYLARSLCWWPNIDSDIENKVNNCFTCQSYQNIPNSVIRSSWPQSTNNWERVHIDFCEIEGKTLLLIFDTKSKWLDVHIMHQTNASITIDKLKHTFSIFGLPCQLVSDNGPPFSSQEFNKFCQANGILPIKSPPYHPISNGSAERSVQTLKCVIKKQLLDMKRKKIYFTMQQRLNNLLFKYRNTPCSVTGISPAEAIFKQKPRTLLDLIKPSFGKNTYPSIAKSGNFFERSLFSVGDKVMVKSNVNDNVKWVPGRILKLISMNTYLVNVDNKVKFIHADHMRHSKLSEEQHPSCHIIPNTVADNYNTDFQKQADSSSLEVVNENEAPEGQNQNEPENNDTTEIVLRRSSRLRKQPQRYGYEVQN